MLQPFLPRFLRDILIDSFAKLTRIRRNLESFAFFVKLYALYFPTH
jgi:hypothetical protein